MSVLALEANPSAPWEKVSRGVTLVVRLAVGVTEPLFYAIPDARRPNRVNRGIRSVSDPNNRPQPTRAGRCLTRGSC